MHAASYAAIFRFLASIPGDKNAGPPAHPFPSSFLCSAATVGAAAASVAVLPRMVTTPQAVVEQAPRPTPERGGGYHESDHVRHYYNTTRI